MSLAPIQNPRALPFRPAPFDAVADRYDETFTESQIGRVQRRAVTEILDAVFVRGQSILELNCGTGADALHLAMRGIEVTACDSSSRMIEIAQRRAMEAGPGARVKFRVLPNEKIASLLDENLAPFDGAFSNFAGFNCTESLEGVARQLAQLLKPRAPFVLCVFGRFCLWETVWYLVRGKPAKAFRRMRRGGDWAQLSSGTPVRVRYPSAREWARIFDPYFHLLSRRGIGVAVPPTYAESLAKRFPRMLATAATADRWLARCPGIRALADHVALLFERR